MVVSFGVDTRRTTAYKEEGMGPLRVLLGALVLGALFTGGYALAARSSVSLTSSGPQPGTVTVDWNDTVAFTNADTVERTVTSDRAQMSSGAIAPGGTFEFQFTGRAGPYRYNQLGTRPTTFGVVVLTATGRVTLRAGRELVPYGSSVTLGGRSSYPATPVQVQFNPAGASGEWSTVANLTASGDGTYAGRTRLTAGGRLRALVAAGQIRSDFVDVRILPRLQMRVSRNRAPKGSRIVITARLTPASAGDSVDLEARFPGESRWERTTTKSFSRQGTATLAVKVPEGRTSYRLSLSRGGLNAGFAPVTSRSALVVGS
jgi:hypothetical protein